MAKLFMSSQLVFSKIINSIIGEVLKLTLANYVNGKLVERQSCLSFLWKTLLLFAILFAISVRSESHFYYGTKNK